MLFGGFADICSLCQMVNILTPLTAWPPYPVKVNLLLPLATLFTPTKTSSTNNNGKPEAQCTFDLIQLLGSLSRQIKPILVNLNYLRKDLVDRDSAMEPLALDPLTIVPSP